MKILHYYIITIFATSLVVVSNPVFADDFTSYGGLTGYRQAYFQGNHGSYPIWYKITNGTVVGTPLDLPAKALLFEINTTSNGQLTVDLPRTIIDSKNGSDDVPYFVSVYDIKSLGGPMKISPEEIDNGGIRTLKINFTKDITEIEIVGTFFVEKYHYAAPNSMSSLSPLKQYESGLAAKDVKCNQEFQLIFKTEDNSPACVKTDTAFHLSTLRWGYLPDPFITKMDLLDSNIVGGKISEFQYSPQGANIILKIQATSNGDLTITIPKVVTDLSPYYAFKTYEVVVDGKEVNVDKITTTKGPRFTIPFTNGTNEIEIMGVEIGGMISK